MTGNMVDVAVVGATGAVGEAMIEHSRGAQFPVKPVHLLASERSAGKRVQFRGKSVMVKRSRRVRLQRRCKLGLFSAGGSTVQAEYAPKAAAAGCVVVDNTSQFRYDDDIPLVVPEVNGHRVADYPTATDHRQPELLDDSDGGGAEADPRCGRRSSGSTSPPTRPCPAQGAAG